MVVHSEKLLRLSFPGFGHVMILLIDMTAKDSNSIGLTGSLGPERCSAADSCPRGFIAAGEAALRAQPREGSGVVAGAAAPTLLLGSFNPDQPPQPFPADSLAVPAGSEQTRFSLRPGHHGSRGGTRPSEQHLTEEPGCSKRDRAGNSRSGWLCPTRYPAGTWPGTKATLSWENSFQWRSRNVIRYSETVCPTNIGWVPAVCVDRGLALPFDY